MFGTWLLLHPSALVGHESVPKAQAVATHSPPTQNLDQPAKQIVIFQRLSMKLCPENGCEKSWDLFSLHFFASNMDSDQFRPLASHLVQRSESRRCKGSSPLASPLRLIQRDVKSESPKRQSNLCPMILNFCGQMICPSPYLFGFSLCWNTAIPDPMNMGIADRPTPHSHLRVGTWGKRTFPGYIFSLPNPTFAWTVGLELETETVPEAHRGRVFDPWVS